MKINRYSMELHSQNEDELEIAKERSPEKRQQIIDELKLT